jgi:hypothetical protein
MTKEQYQEAIDKQVERRGRAINEIAEMTREPYSTEALIEWAEIALDAYKMTRMLRTQMRAAYPILCTCVCDEHKQKL